MAVEAATYPDDVPGTTGDSNPSGVPAPYPSRVSRRIGKYDVIGLLGKGAMGAVYHAVDPLLERDVALKVMLAQSAEDPEQKQRFEREARAVARLMHPNVVMLFDLGYHTDGSPYIVMELLRGRDLLETTRQGALSFTRIVEIVLDVLQGLRHAHDGGIIHRDIKPANVFLCDDGSVKIMDFGVAQFGALDLTASGIVVGTANYMSPEQIVGERVDGRSDLWSVGCMLYELVAGRPPFEGGGVVRTLYNIAHREPVFDLPEDMEAGRLLPILKRALAKDPEDRYPTTQEFAAELRGLLAAPAGVVAPVVSVVAPTPPPPPAVLRRDVDPTALLKLVRDSFAGRKSGHLHFTHGRERRSLTVYQGRLLHATSDVAGEHLGDVLVRYGHLSQADLHRALSVVLRERRRLGAVLTELRLIERSRLVEAVGLHVREVLFTMMERTDGSHSAVFEETSEALIDPDLGSEQSTGNVVLEAVRRVHDDDLVKRALGNLDRAVAVLPDPARSEPLTLTPTDGFVLSRIDGVFTAEQVVSLVPLPRADVLRSLFGLLCAGAIDYVPEPARPRSPTPPDTLRRDAPQTRTVPPPPPPLPAAAAPVPPVEPQVPAPREIPRAEDLRKTVLELFEASTTKDHFEFLRVERSATDAQIRDAWARLARVLHPDSWRNAALADLHEIRDAVFVRLTEASKVLRDPGKRSRYEREHPPRFVEAPPAPDSTAAPAGDPPPGASRDEAPRGPSIGELVHKGEVLLKNEKYWEAIQILEPLIARAEGPTKARARVNLALAYLKNPHWVRRAEDLLLDVVRDRPQHAAAYLVLGRLYRGSGFPKRAACMYKKVLELEPEDAEAAQALAEIEAPSPARGPRRLRAILG